MADEIKGTDKGNGNGKGTAIAVVTSPIPLTAGELAVAGDLGVSTVDLEASDKALARMRLDDERMAKEAARTMRKAMWALVKARAHAKGIKLE